MTTCRVWMRREFCELNPNDVADRVLPQCHDAPLVEVLEDPPLGIEAFLTEETSALDAVGTPAASVDLSVGRAARPPTAHLGYRSPDRLWYGGIAVFGVIAAAGGFLLAGYSPPWRPMVPPSQVASTQGNASGESNQGQDSATDLRRAPYDDRVGVGGDPGGNTSEESRVAETDGTSVTAGASWASSETPGAATPAPARAPERAITSTAPGDEPTLPHSWTHSPAGNLSGWWSVTNRVESTADRPFESLNLGYRLKLTQKGDHISGTGVKWMENGRQLPPTQRTSIAVHGIVEQGRVVLEFTEHGTRRASAGKFTYDMSGTDVLQGSFTSDVGQSTGRSRARRMQSND